MVTDGLGEGERYILLPGYVERFCGRFGYEPFSGTLNVELTDDSVRKRKWLQATNGIWIDEWENDDRTYGAATC